MYLTCTATRVVAAGSSGGARAERTVMEPTARAGSSSPYL